MKFFRSKKVESVVSALRTTISDLEHVASHNAKIVEEQDAIIENAHIKSAAAEDEVLRAHRIQRKLNELLA